MKLQTTKLVSINKWSMPGMCMMFLGLIISGCSTTPLVPTAAPTIDTTALVAQVAQTLEAKYTQQAPKLPSQAPAETLLPTVIDQTFTPVPLPVTTLQPTALITTLFPMPTYTSVAGVTVATSAGGVAAPPALFAVIHVITSINQDDISASCPPGYDFQFTASISTNGAGTVTYNWEFSDNSKTDTKTLTFNSAGTQVVSTDWNLGANNKTPGSNPYKGWGRITIVQPNNQVFPRASFKFECK